MEQLLRVNDYSDSLLSALNMLIYNSEKSESEKTEYFSPEEDEYLINYFEQQQFMSWGKIVEEMAIATGKPLRSVAYVSQRWRRVLEYKEYKQSFTEAEDKMIIDLYHMGYKWAQIAKKIGKRTDLQVKYRIKTLLNE